ncbi:aminoglycoside phosphotransferase family protein [Deinococcus pimensis]|uniref:aminoglycoside phosphotransferase family protein n=1 Tax=Deinococcus pimensis TaxID=309888 RepID=UPI0005EB084E|nr:aminoglycoside phosphotransferase family protein [Deinococcus pimensis]
MLQTSASARTRDPLPSHDGPREHAQTARERTAEPHVDPALVTRLVTAQCPHLAHLDVRPARALGTVHVLYHLGEDLVVRPPRVGVSKEKVDKEHAWLPRLAPRLRVPIPVPVAGGAPTPEYPCEWSVYTWLRGENPTPGRLDDPEGFALDLAAFVTTLHALNVVDAPPSERGRRSLRDLDASACAATEQAHGLIGVEAATHALETALRAHEWDGHAVWVHADLLPGNLLIEDGRLNGMLDFGALGTGDPASDLNVAWSVLPREAREVFRDALGANEGTWARARGLALVIALQALPYYQHTHPAFALVARYVITEILDEHGRNV